MACGADTRAGRFVNARANNNVGGNVKAGRRGDRVYHPWASARVPTTPAGQTVVIRLPEQHRS